MYAHLILKSKHDTVFSMKKLGERGGRRTVTIRIVIWVAVLLAFPVWAASELRGGA